MKTKGKIIKEKITKGKITKGTITKGKISGKKWIHRALGGLLAAWMCAAAVGTQTAAQASGVSGAQSAGTTLSELAGKRSIMALVNLCEETQVRTGADGDSPAAAEVSVGQTVFIRDAVYNEEEERLWIRVRFTVNGTESEGYIPREFLACSDERFLSWEKKYYPETAKIRILTAGTGEVFAR